VIYQIDPNEVGFQKFKLL